MTILITEHFIQIVSDLTDTQFTDLVEILLSHKLSVPNEKAKIVIYTDIRILYLIILELSKYYDLHII